MKQLLSDCVKEFVESEYSKTKGKVRSEVTNQVYKSLSNQILQILDKKDLNIFDYDTANLNPIRDRRKYKKVMSGWEKVAIEIKKQSKHLSETTLKSRLSFMSHVLTRIEDEYGINTPKKLFKYKTQRGSVVVINKELFKKTVRTAKEVCMDNESTDQRKLGALTFVLCAYTSARLRDLMELRYSKNINFGNYYSPTYLTYRNRKTKTAPINIKLPNDVVNIIFSMKNGSDFILRGYTDVTMRNNFKDFLMSMEEYHQKVTRTTPMANGTIKTEQIPMFELITPHKVRATFITQMIERGIDLETIMSFSGHSNVLTLSNRYANVSDVHKETQYESYTSIFE